MQTVTHPKVTIQSTVHADQQKVWKLYNAPEHVIQWNTPSPDWHTPKAESDLREGGSFCFRMEAKDGSFGFDFGGIYDKVKPNEFLSYTLGDGRRAEVSFIDKGDSTDIQVVFEAEGQNPVEFQQAGWQSILDNFKRHVEAQ